MWYPNGRLQMECNYEHGVPTGRACEWSSEGWLYKDVKINKFPNDFNLTLMNKQGAKIRVFENGIQDFGQLYDDASEKIKSMDQSIQDHLKNLNPYLNEEKTFP